MQDILQDIAGCIGENIKVDFMGNGKWVEVPVILSPITGEYERKGGIERYISIRFINKDDTDTMLNIRNSKPLVNIHNGIYQFTGAYEVSTLSALFRFQLIEE